MEHKILYISLHNLLRKRFGNNWISQADLYCELGRHFLIPKQIRENCIEELISMKLLERMEKNYYKLLEINLEKDSERILKVWFCYH